MMKAFVLFLALNSFSSLWAKEKVVLTSFYPIHIATMNVVANISDIRLLSLTKPFSGCLHDYQLTPQDMITLSRADYFVVNGAGMEAFLEKAVTARKNLKVIEASRGIKLLNNNAHIWLSPTLAIAQVKNIASQLIEQMPEHKLILKKNADTYVKKLELLRDQMKVETKDLKSRSFVTFHEAFPYFAQEFNLTISAVIEREPGTEPNAKELASIIEQLRRSTVKVIFAEPQYSAKSAETIARESGAKVFKLDPVVSGEYNSDAYLQIMSSNLATLKKALK